MKYQYLMIDLDDTILNFAETERMALGKAFEQLFGRILTNAEVEEYSRINQDCWKMLERKEIDKTVLKDKRFRDFVGFLDIELVGVTIEQINDVYMGHLGQIICEMPGAGAAIRKLAKSYRIFLITNGTAWVQKSRLSLLAFSDCFERVLISDELGENKPSPVFFDAVLAVTGDTDKSRYLVIGDSMTSDMGLGRNTGIDTCLFGAEKVPNEQITYATKDWSAVEKLLL